MNTININSLNAEQQAIVKAVRDLGGFNDAHDNDAFRPYKGQLSLFTHEDGEQFVCPVFEYTYASINPIEMHNDQPRLSRWSVGGLFEYGKANTRGTALLIEG